MRWLQSFEETGKVFITVIAFRENVQMIIWWKCGSFFLREIRLKLSINCPHKVGMRVVVELFYHSSMDNSCNVVHPCLLFLALHQKYWQQFYHWNCVRELLWFYVVLTIHTKYAKKERISRQSNHKQTPDLRNLWNLPLFDFRWPLRATLFRERILPSLHAAICSLLHKNYCSTDK